MQRKAGAISRKAQFLNYAEDGIKIRSQKFGKNGYQRKVKHAHKKWEDE